jgi:hypothetical protein
MYMSPGPEIGPLIAGIAGARTEAFPPTPSVAGGVELPSSPVQAGTTVESATTNPATRRQLDSSTSPPKPALAERQKFDRDAAYIVVASSGG